MAVHSQASPKRSRHSLRGCSKAPCEGVWLCALRLVCSPARRSREVQRLRIEHWGQNRAKLCNALVGMLLEQAPKHCMKGSGSAPCGSSARQLGAAGGLSVCRFSGRPYCIDASRLKSSEQLLQSAAQDLALPSVHEHRREDGTHESDSLMLPEHTPTRCKKGLGLALGSACSQHPPVAACDALRSELVY